MWSCELSRWTKEQQILCNIFPDKINAECQDTEIVLTSLHDATKQLGILYLGVHHRINHVVFLHRYSRYICGIGVRDQKDCEDSARFQGNGQEICST